MKVELLKLPSGRVPFGEWLETLPLDGQAKVLDFIKRVADGGSRKNVKALGDSLYEIKIAHRSGYRIYFRKVGGTMLLIITGGDKSSQRRDIEKAKKYWRIINV